MRIIFLLLLHLAPLLILAQPAIPATTSEAMAEREFGWLVKDPLAKQTPSAKATGKFKYSVQQVSTAWNFLKWMQQDFTPKGFIGESKWYLNTVYKNNDPKSIDHVNSLVNGVPQSYGAYSRFYLFLKYNAQQKVVPENNLNLRWHIAANEIRNISLPVE